MRPSFPALAAFLAGAAFAAAVASSCFQPPPLSGPFLCAADQACPSPYTCDDGVCCTPDAGGGPLECPSYVGRDGRCSDGGTPRVWFQDLDQDGYGAADAGRLTCRQPASYPATLDAGDCDDSPAFGAATHPGVPDGCDQKDNDCDGQTDEGPTCGGPRSLFIDLGMSGGAKKLKDNWFSQTPSRCLRDDPVDTAVTPDAYDQFMGTWHGIRSTTHVLWAQGPAGTTWDLSTTGRQLRVRGVVQVNSANEGGSPGWIWVPPTQPWLMLCGPAGFVRLAPDTSVFSLTVGNPVGFDETFSVRGGNGWSIQPGSTADVDAVLRQVEHVEVLVELEPASGGPSFDITFDVGLTGFP